MEESEIEKQLWKYCERKQGVLWKRAIQKNNWKYYETKQGVFWETVIQKPVLN